MFSRQLLLVVVLVILLSLAPTRTEATSKQPRVLWQQKGLNNGNSPPLLITKNYLFPMNGGNILFVVNKTNGNVVFKHNFSASMQFFEQVAEHPTDPHKLYFLFSDSVYCYDIKNEATSQKPQWTFQFDNFYQNIQVAAGARYLLVYGPNAATIAFVDIKTGNKTKEIHSSGGYVISDSGAIINQRQQYGFFERIDPLTTEVMWTSTIPIFSAPSCAKNGLVAGVASAQFRNMTRQSNQSVAVLRVEDGTVAWSREIPRSDGLLPLQLNCGGSLIFAGRHEDQRVFGFNMQSGADVLEFIAKGQAFTFTVNSIRVVSNMAIFCDMPLMSPTSQNVFPHYHAVDISTGKELWKITTAPYSQLSPSFAAAGDYFLIPNIMGYTLFNVHDGSLMYRTLDKFGGVGAFVVDNVPEVSFSPIAFIVGGDGLIALEL